MTTKFVVLISVIGLAGICLVQAQSPTPGESPVASPSPAKHRMHKKAEATASPAAPIAASPSPAEKRTRKTKKTTAATSPSPGVTSVSRVHRKLSEPPPTKEMTYYYKRTLGYQAQMDGNVPDRSVIFVGDSLIQGLCTDAVTCPSVNYGIGGDTTVGVLARLPEYHSLHHASAVVLAIGVNDMKFRDNQQIVQNYARILNALPQGISIICSAVLPVNERAFTSSSVVNNARINDLDASLKTLCSNDSRCVFVDARSRLADQTGNLSVAFRGGAGLHLNAAGNRIWIDELRNGLGKAQQGAANR